MIVYNMTNQLDQKCLMCDTPNIDFFKGLKNIVKCKNCLSVYTIEPFPDNTCHTDIKFTPTTLQKFYAKRVHHFVSNLDSKAYLGYLKEKTTMQFKNALDIGTGYGTMVRDLNKLGINAYGIESNEHAFRLSATDKIEHTNFDINFKSDQKFDLICISQVIYFFRDTTSILKMLMDMLNPNGVLFIVTTNTDSSLLTKESIGPRPASLNMIAGSNFYKNLNGIGFDLLDISVFRSNIGVDMHPSKNKKLEFIKYRLGLKKGFVKDPDGQQMFILLKKSIK